MWRHFSLSPLSLHPLHQATAACSAQHEEEIKKLKAKGRDQNKIMEAKIREEADRTFKLQADLYRAEDCAARQWQNRQELEKKLTQAAEAAQLLTMKNQQLEQRSDILQRKMSQQKKFHETLRKKKTNSGRTRKKQAKIACAKAVASARSCGANIVCERQNCT